MPYASSIQVVNDANGTAYAFLADNGAIWQCQWDGQAQLWAQGQLVPLAFGGEKLQALYLSNLWPAGSSGADSAGSTPGIVLAYRVGEGAGAEVYGSFGQWGSDGLLGWSEPQQLTDDQVEDQAFSLVQGEQGGFSLVVQKQQAGVNSTAILDKIKGSDPGQFESALAAATSAERPDSDLYVNQYNLTQAGTPLNPSWQLTSPIATAKDQLIVWAPKEASSAASPLSLSGNTQLSRQELYPATTTTGSDLAGNNEVALMGVSATSSVPQSGWSWQGGAAKQFNSKNGSSLRLGVMPGLDPLRWKLDYPAVFPKNDFIDESVGNLDSSSDLSESSSEIGEIADASSDMLDMPVKGGIPGEAIFSDLQNVEEISRIPEGSFRTGRRYLTDQEQTSNHSDFQLFLKGMFGLSNLGQGGPTSISSAKLGGEFGNSSRRGVAASSFASFDDGITDYKSGKSIGLGGSLRTVYQYDNMNPGHLTGLHAAETISIDLDYTGLELLPGGSTMTIVGAADVGYSWEQSVVAESGYLPAWLGYIGWTGGLAADLAKKAAMGYGLKEYSGAGIRQYSSDAYALQTKRQVMSLKRLSDINSSHQTVAAVVGSTMAALGPATALVVEQSGQGLDGATFENTRGEEIFARLTGRYLWHSLVGFQATVGNKYNANWAGVNKGNWQDTFFAIAGIAFPLGSSISLLNYHHTWTHPKPDDDDTTGVGATQSASAGSASGGDGFYAGAPTGNDYPFLYTPSTASSSYLAPTTSSKSATNPYLLGAKQTENLQFFTLGLYDGLINYTPPKGSSQAKYNNSNIAVTLSNAGKNLNPGNYTKVPLLGVTAEGTEASGAYAAFTVDSSGNILASSFQITAAGQYLHLPETEPNSTIYALMPDVFSTGIAILPDPTASDLGNTFRDLPLITIVSASANSNLLSPLTTQPISRVQMVADSPVSFSGTINGNQLTVTAITAGSLAVGDVISGPGILAGTTILSTNPMGNGGLGVYTINKSQTFTGITTLKAIPAPMPANQPAGIIYPNYDPSTDSTTPPAADNNSPYTYSNVAVQLLAAPITALTSTTAVSLLNPGAVTATVHLSAGVIQRVELDQPLLFVPVAGSAQQYSIQLTLPDAVLNTLPPSTTTSFDVDTEQAAFNNFVADDQFSAQPGPVNAGVYIAAGISDQIPLHASMGSWPVQNRVSYVTNQETVYLNGIKKSTAENVYVSIPVVTQSDLYPNSIYNDSEIFFSAASSPTAITIVGNGSYPGDTFVAWVEASEQVIPNKSKGDGAKSFQDFMDKLYGSQRINFRIQTASGWQNTNLTYLYTPEEPSVIRHLKAFNVERAGSPATLLVWTETSIDAIKGAVAEIGSGDAVQSSIKTGWIDATSSSTSSNNSILWNNLVTDVGTIPWDPSTDVGLTINDITIGSLPYLQSDGSIVESPLVSWSQDVRTPYRQSVLNDDPLLYLQFGDLQSGYNAINIGSLKDPTTTGTQASSTGLNFAIAGALSKSQASAVQNTDGTGVLSTGLGSMYAPIRDIVNNIPAGSLASSADSIANFSGTINGTELTVTAITAGSLAVGDVISGPGILAGTTIKEIKTGNGGVGVYTINQSQTLTDTTTLEAIPAPSTFPLSSFSGAISGTTLTVDAISRGLLQLGDQLIGEGVAPGTFITAVNTFDANQGTGTYTVSIEQTVPDSALVAIPGQPTTPYTIEFWAQLAPGSNTAGAGLVAFGQPSSTAVGAATAPDGWLLSSSFVVDYITYQQAAAQSLIPAIPTGTDPSSLYGWAWGVVADGANTTAMNGSGGSNLYSNALQINNLVSGASLVGINQFLANYQLTSNDLTGIDNTNADTIAAVPTTQLQFDHALDSAGQPVSSLNNIAIDTSSALLNQGLILASDLNTVNNPSANPNAARLNAMFGALWDFQQKTGEAKVNLSLAPDSNKSTTTANGQLPDSYTSEQYAGYELDFLLQNGVAVSVNGSGQLVFDFGNNESVTTDLPADLRDNQWHYIAATYLPTYQSYNVNGTVAQLATNVGTASLYVDNKLAASQSNVFNAYAPINLNDQALLLANNVSGAIDQLAFYDKALTPSSFTPNTSGQWPMPTTEDALALLAAMGYGINTKTPDPGAIPGAVSSHWLASNVNPNDALLGTYYSIFTPDTTVPGGGSWSQASNLNPSLAPQATIPSASRPGSLQNDLVISVPVANWTSSEDWLLTNATTNVFNPAGQQLFSVSVTLTNASDATDTSTVTLTPEQVLLGSNSLLSLQPQATSGDYQYFVPTNLPAFNLVIDKGNLSSNQEYKATYTFTFITPSTPTGKTTVTSKTPITINTTGSAIGNSFNTGVISADSLNRVETFSSAIATAAVIEQAPLQLKYIDSGEVFKSASSLAAANSPTNSTPANSFGQSQVYGSFGSTTGTNSGWLAIAQPLSANASSNPAGRVWINFTGNFTLNSDGSHKASTTAALAPNTWLNALAESNFSPDSPNLPLLGDATNPSTSGGLLIQADPTVGWGNNFGQNMLAADVNNDGIQDLVIAAPQANGGGRVYIISGEWIQDKLTSADGGAILDLANPDQLGDYVTVLTASKADSADNITVAGFGTALAYDTTTNTLWIGAPNYLSTIESSPIASFSGTIDGNQLTVTAITAGSLAVGDVISATSGNSILAGTTITSITTGNGGVGVYTINQSQTLTDTTTLEAQQVSLQPIGALYGYNYGNLSSAWGTGVAQALENPILGSGGTVTTLDSSNAPITSFWGSQFGTAIATNSDGAIAISAPGFNASMIYSGTNEVGQRATIGGNKNTSTYGDGALLKIQLPDSSNNVAIASGVSDSTFVDIANQDISKKSELAKEESAYMQNLKALQVDNIAVATEFYNQAFQTDSVGAVYLFSTSTDLQTIANSNSSSSTIKAELVASAAGGGATFYGPNPWNVLGASGFGSSLALSDLKNTNSSSTLAIGASQTGGSGALYLVDTQQAFTKPQASQPDWLSNINTFGSNQYLAHLASSTTLYGAASLDYFANGLVNLGDVNADGYDDLLIQAFNASSGAGNGYVLFGSDQVMPTTSSGTPNPATGSVAPGSIGSFKRADGTSFNTAILTELGNGSSAYTGQGSFGAGDINSDGLNDIPLGSGPNGSSYLTWGHPYLEAITNLQLSKLASNTGYLLDGLATTTQGSLRSIGDFNGDGYGDFISINPGSNLTTVRIELGANTQEILADYAYEYYTFTVANGTEVLPGGDINGDGMDDIALFLDQNLSSAADGNQGAGSSTGILYGRNSNDLPLGSGFGFIAMVDPSTSAPLAPLPGDALGTGLTDAAPSVIAVGDTLYAAVKGVGSTTTSIWFTQSTDGGNTWNGWTNLTSSNAGFSTSNGPSLAFYNEKLYLSFVDSAGTLSLSSWDPTSNDPTDWSSPYVIGTSSDNNSGFQSLYSPQLIQRGDALGVVWAEQLTTTTITPSSWSTRSGSVADAAMPALAEWNGTLYMATQTDEDGIIWTSSTDNGTTWAEWSSVPLPPGFSIFIAPLSLAVINNSLCLSFIGADIYKSPPLPDGVGDVYITNLPFQKNSTWTDPYVIQQAQSYASLITETVDKVEQLAVYSVAAPGFAVATDGAGNITKAYTQNPESQTGWNSLSLIDQASSGPLAATFYEGRTYLAYQTSNTTAFAPGTIVMTNSGENAPSNTPSYGYWTEGEVIAIVEVGTPTVVGLTSGNELTLSYGDDNSPTELQIIQFKLESGALKETNSYSESLPTGLSNNVALLNLDITETPTLFLAGTNTTSTTSVIQTSTIEVTYPTSNVLYASFSTTPDGSNAEVSWATPTQLLQRTESDNSISFVPITTTDASSFTWLGDVPVLALNNNGTINVYAGTQSGATLELTSSFTAPAGLSIVSAPVLTTTDTGLALTYTNSDDSITLQRLNFVSSSGAPLPGVQFNSDGSINTSNADLQWQSTTLTAANSGISTALASTPVSVNGNLLLTNVRNSSTLDNQIWINAVPNASNPDSTTWLNSTVQLPDTSGGWILSQQAGANNLTSAQTGSTISAIGDINADGFDDLAITANGVVYNNQHTTGVRFVLGAATATAFSSANDATAENQTVQIASLYPQFQIGATPVANLSGPTTLNLNGALGGSRYQISSTAVSTSASPLSNADVTATSSNPSSLQQLFAGAKSKSLGDTFPYTFDGSLSLQALAGYGDLNGDGYADYLALDGLDYVSTASGTISFSVWSIRAAGDVNGNGLDDVLLTLAPKGPAYVAAADGSPTALQSVLVDGALFKVDTKNNTFSLANLKNPLNPYNSGEIYDVTSDSNSQFLPLLQNWFEPILTFEPGSLPTKATIGFEPGGLNIPPAYDFVIPIESHINQIPDSIKTQVAPAVVVDAMGNPTLFYPGSTSGSGIWCATLDIATRNWSQFSLPSALNNVNYLYSPSAAIYGDTLYLAYIDNSGNLYIAYTKANTDGQPNYYESADWNSYQVVTTQDESSAYSPALVVEEGRLALYFASNMPSSGSSNDYGRTQQLRYLYSNNPDADNPSWGSSLETSSSAKPAPYSGVSGNLTFAQGTNTDQYTVSSSISATTYQGRTVLAMTGNGGGNSNSVASIRIATAPSANPAPGDNWLYWANPTASADYLNGNGYIGITTDQSLLYISTALGTEISQDSTSTPDSLPSYTNTSQVYSLSPSQALGTYNISSSYNGPKGVNRVSNPNIFMYQGVPILAWANSSQIPLIDDLEMVAGAPLQPSLAGYSIDGNIDVNGDGFTDILISDPSDPSEGVDNQYVLFGGDYLNIASQVGTAGNDTLIGTPLADVIYTLSGDDVVYANGGSDVIYTGSGNDQIAVKANGTVDSSTGTQLVTGNEFIRIDGGSGFDQLLLQGLSDQAYYFQLATPSSSTIFAGTKLKDIELISSVDYGSNTLSFDAAAINAINPDRILFLTPDAADFINFSTEFNPNQSFDTSYGGSLWYAYAAGPASTTNPTLAYVRVPDGETASTWLSSHVNVGGPTPASLQSSVAFSLAQDSLAPLSTAALAASSLQPPSPSAAAPAAANPSMVAGTTSFGDGLTITAYRTTPGSGVARFQISRDGDLSRSQLISYVSSSLNSSAEPGRHYTPVAGLLRLDAGQASAEISVPVDSNAIAALRNGTLSLKVAELDDRGQKQTHLLLDVDQASGGLRPVLSGLDLQVDDSGASATIGFRADINKAALKENLATTLNLNVRRRLSADRSTNDLGNRNQTLSISDGLLAKFDQDRLDNDQVQLEFVLNTITGSVQLQAATTELNPLILSKLDPTRKPITVGIELTTTSLDAIPVATPPSGVLLNQTAIDFTVDADSSGKAKLFLDLTQVGDDLVLKDDALKRKDKTHLLYYGIDETGALSALTYNARHKAGARFYDTDGDSIADFVSLTFVDGGMGDTGPKGDGKVHDPSTAGTVNLQNVLLTAVDSRTLQAADKDNKDAPASLVLRAGLNSRTATTNQIYYVVHDITDSASIDSIFADIDELRERSQTLYTSLESTDVTLAPGTTLSRDILLINGQHIRFFEVVDGTLDQLTSANDGRLRVFSTGGFSSGSRSGNFSSTSGVSLALSLVEGDQGLGALIGQEQGLARVLDFTAFTADQRIEGTVTLAREASFDSVIGFYRTLDLQGTVWRDHFDQTKGTITPGQVGTTAADYGAAALRNMVDGLTGLQVGNRQTSNLSISLQESNYLAPIAQVKGNTFVAFDRGNADGISHFVSLGSNMFGFEDLYGGGDRDFDDQVIGFAFSKVFTPAV